MVPSQKLPGMQRSIMKRKKSINQNQSRTDTIIEFVHKDIKSVIITIFHMFKMLEEKLKIVK